MVQGFLMLALTALWVPSAGASWAYCQRFGVVHPAEGTCCGDEQASSDHCDCCEGGQQEKPSKDDCCIAVGKMLPEALLPVTGNPVPNVLIAPEFGAVNVVESVVPPISASFLSWHLRGPPPDRALFLVLRSLRL